MKSFITQFCKARLGKKRLIYDAKENRYLVTHSKVWETWSKCKLIYNFR